MGLFDLASEEATNEDGMPVTPGITPPRIFAKNPFYGDTRLIPASIMPRDTSFDSILAEGEARRQQSSQSAAKAQQGAWDIFSDMMARALRGPGARPEQAPAPVFDAAPQAVWHFDP